MMSFEVTPVPQRSVLSGSNARECIYMHYPFASIFNKYLLSTSENQMCGMTIGSGKTLQKKAEMAPGLTYWGDGNQ